MEHRITDIHCPQCGAPADFDIVRQMYVCGHCGGNVLQRMRRGSGV